VQAPEEAVDELRALTRYPMKRNSGIAISTSFDITP